MLARRAPTLNVSLTAMACVVRQFNTRSATMNKSSMHVQAGSALSGWKARFTTRLASLVLGTAITLYLSQ
jgi:hypothetical protein